MFAGWFATQNEAIAYSKQFNGKEFGKSTDISTRLHIFIGYGCLV
jgi:hypothetical protein